MNRAFTSVKVVVREPAVQTSTVLFESRKFRIVRRAALGRDGAPRTFDVIDHRGAIVVLPLLDDGRIVLIRNERPAVGESLLELPAGTLDAGEEPIACARRELTEETGYRAGRLRPLLTFYTTPGMTNERMHAFVAEELSPGQASPEPDERIEPVATTWDDALDAIRDGRIADGKTIATLLYYRCFASR